MQHSSTITALQTISVGYYYVFDFVLLQGVYNIGALEKLESSKLLYLEKWLIVVPIDISKDLAGHAPT